MRTINRPPMSVNIPDVDYKYFNHYNWKGLNTNKNYYDLDPETFESAKNIYMDEKGVLKSRPSLHILNDIGLKNIIDAWSFGNIQVYLTDNEHYELYFVNDGEIIKNDGEPVKATLKEKFTPLIIRNGDKIFVFASGSLDGELGYYDINKKEYVQDSADYNYVPITKIITNGVIEENESLNVLNNKERYLYNYGPELTMDFTQLYNADVTVKTEDYTKHIERFSDIERDLFIFKRHDNVNQFSAPGLHDSYTSTIGYKFNRPLISVSDVNTYLFCKPTLVKDGEYRRFEYNVYYSLDGLILTELPEITDCLVEPKISLDGIYACAIKQDGVYCLSLTKDSDEDYKYPNWTKVYELEIPRYYADEPDHTDTTSDYNDYNVMINGLFYSDNRYVICYGYGLTRCTGGNKFLCAETLQVIVKNIDNVTESKINLRTKDTDDYIAPIRPHIDGKFYDDGTVSYVVYYHTSETDLFTVSANYNIKLYNANDYRKNWSGWADYAVIFKNKDVYIMNSEKEVYSLAYSTKYSETYVRKIQYLPYAYNTFSNGKLISTRFKNNDKLVSQSVLYTNDFPYGDYSIFDWKVYGFENNWNGFDTYTIGINDNIHFVMQNYFWNNVLDKNVELYKTMTGVIKRFKFSLLTVADTCYAAYENKLFTGENRYSDDGDLLYYFPKDNIATFAETISALHPISNNQVGIFLQNEIWYTTVTENGRTLEKSKIALGCNIGDEVVSSFDGKYTIFPSKRGLVALSYQDFVASTEQTVTYLSDAILSEFTTFVKNGRVRLFLYKYWLFCYQNTSNQLYLFDFRNNSWWMWQLTSPVNCIINVDNEPELIVNKKRVGLDYSDENYFDYDGTNRVQIDWHLTSQKLNLGTLNNYKHVINLTLNALQESDLPMYMTLSLANYRDTATKIDGKVLEYQVDVLKTFVKRLNYYKVNHFQYKLENTPNLATQIPLSIDSVSIKYKITGQVR